MSENSNQLGLLLKELLHKRSLSMRKVSERTEIDTATISRIINGKRKANLHHLEKFAACLEVPIVDLLKAAGYPMEQTQAENKTDITMSVKEIQNILEASRLYDSNFSTDAVDQQLNQYGQHSNTQDGQRTIHNSFEEKLEKVGSSGPFINLLRQFYERFIHKKGTPFELAIIGGALLYFIIPIDVIPDYVFPIGYLDDAIAVQISLKSLSNGAS